MLLYLNAPGAITRTVHEVLNATEVQKKIMDDSILNRNDRYKAASMRMEMHRPNIQQFAMAFATRDKKRLDQSGLCQLFFMVSKSQIMARWQ